jgi:hypothetical protein
LSATYTSRAKVSIPFRRELKTRI